MVGIYAAESGLPMQHATTRRPPARILGPVRRKFLLFVGFRGVDASERVGHRVLLKTQGRVRPERATG